MVTSINLVTEFGSAREFEDELSKVKPDRINQGNGDDSRETRKWFKRVPHKHGVDRLRRVPIKTITTQIES